MVPNHVFSLLSMVAMEPPTGFDAARDPLEEGRSACRDARRQAGTRRCAANTGPARCWARRSRPIGKSPMWRRIRTSRPMSPCSLRSTTGAGPACLSTSAPASTCRSANTEIAIRFKQAPYTAFQDTPVDTLRPNWLVLRIAPDEGISLQFEVKRRGPVVDLAAVKMDFHYNDWFPKEPNVGYETLIYDVMIGDPTLFMRADMVEQAWRIVQPVLDAWAAERADFPNYDSGSDGPEAADELLHRDGGPCMAAGQSGLRVQQAMSGQRAIHLLLADVDGTLVTQDKVLTDAAKAVVRDLHDAGIAFAITSGRPPRGMAMLIAPLALRTPIAGFNGGVFVNPDLSVIESHALDPRTAKQAVAAYPRPGARRMGLYRRRVVDPRSERAACGARGMDGQVRCQGRGIVH